MKKTVIFFAALLFVITSIAIYLGYSAKPEVPKLAGSHADQSLLSTNLQRYYKIYIPSNLKPDSPLLLVLHGSMQSIDDIRTYTGYEFERLAEQHGFALIYPQGFKNNWNDCRKSASYPAKVENIDDLAFMQALIETASKDYGIDKDKVFLSGWSNGGHLGFKAALEKPDMFAAIAAISANLPTPDNSDCSISDADKTGSMLIMNGTADPINPHEGGRVTLFGFGDRGNVLSSQDSISYFATRAGYSDSEIETALATNPQPQGSVSIKQWQAENKPALSLVTIQDGGHLIPQPYFRAPRILGRNTPALNGPELIWHFFQQAP